MFSVPLREARPPGTIGEFRTVLGCVTSSCDIARAEGLSIIEKKKGTNILPIRERAASDNSTEESMRGSPNAGEDNGLSRKGELDNKNPAPVRVGYLLVRGSPLR